MAVSGGVPQHSNKEKVCLPDLILDAANHAEYTWPKKSNHALEDQKKMQTDACESRHKTMTGKTDMCTRIGIGCLLGAFFVWLFSGISGFMQADNFWVGLTLSRLIGDYAILVVRGAPGILMKDIVYFLMFDLPFYAVLLGMGTVCLVAGMFVNARS